MEALKEWVRGLVMLLIVASLLELLLPINSMKKYIRMAMGLLIILGVVKPVVALLGQPVSFDPSLLVSDERSVPTVNQIMADADRFRAKSEALLLEEVQGRLAAEARSAARQVEGVADARVAVQVRPRRGIDSYQIERITVTLQPGSRFGQVRPVEPVRAGPGSRAVDPPVEAEPALADPVRRAVASHLGLTDLNLIQVLVDRPGQPRR